MGDVAGHILHQDFFDNMRIYLENMSESRLDYLQIMGRTAFLLNSAVHDGVAVANHTVCQNKLLETHIELMTSTDMQLVYLSHLGKIVDFMPDVAYRLGSPFVYEDPETLPRDIPKGHWQGDIYCCQDFTEATENRKHNRSTKTNSIEWDLDLYSDLHSIRQAMGEIIKSSYINIDSLRFLMSQRTLHLAREHDSFSMNVINGRLSEVEDTPLRMESSYFALHGQRLGLFPENIPPHLSDALDASANPTEFITQITPQFLHRTQYARPKKSQPRLVRH